MRLTMPYTLFILCTLLSGNVAAQVYDPTRPADVPLETTGGGNANGVQAIIMRKGGKSSAVVAGQTVRVGDWIGDKASGKQVLKISENAVIFQGKSGRETLRLIPAVEKVPTAKPRAVKHRAQSVQGGRVMGMDKK